MGLRGRTEHEEGRLDAEIVERGEDGVGLARPRTVIEGQDDFAGTQDDIGGRSHRECAAAQVGG